jgi:hypothetical protein
LTQLEKEAIRRVVANVAASEVNRKEDRRIQETDAFLQNKSSFMWWLAAKLGSKAEDFLRRIGTSSGVMDLYIFSYAIEHPGDFAQKMIETLEGAQ